MYYLRGEHDSLVGVCIELASGDHSQHVRGASGESHFMTHAQSLVHLDEVLGRQDLDEVTVLVLQMVDSLRSDASMTQLVSHLTVF